MYRPLALMVNRLVGAGPVGIGCFDDLYRDSTEAGSKIHQPESFSGVLCEVPADSGIYAPGFSLLGQTPEPELIEGAPRYRLRGVCPSGTRRLFSVTDVGVAGRDGVVYCPRRRIAISETVRQWRQPASRHPLFSAPGFPSSSQALSGLTLSLGTLDGEGFYHFLIEAFPRLHLARPWLEPVDHVLVSGSPHSFQEQWLKRAGVPGEKIIWLTPFSHFRCEQLLFTNPLCADCRPTPWLVHAIRSAAQFVPEPAARARRLWISRGDATMRRLDWEGSLLSALPGFERVELARLSPTEQIGLLAQAAVVAGPHGAGFANLVFCAPGTRVIELCPDLRHRPLYARLSAAAACRHAWAAVEFDRVPAELAALAEAISRFSFQSPQGTGP